MPEHNLDQNKELIISLVNKYYNTRESRAMHSHLQEVATGFAVTTRACLGRGAGPLGNGRETKVFLTVQEYFQRSKRSARTVYSTVHSENV